MNSKSKSKLPLKKILIVTAILIVVVGVFRYFNVQEVLQDILEWISGLGFMGAVIYFVIYIIACVFMIPGSILTIGAGVIYGVVWGSILVTVSATTGATVAFIIGRYFARDWVQKRLEKNPKFSAIDRAVGKEGWKIVGLTRLSPAFPFNIQNYMYGLTQVSLRDYFFATLIGMLPATVMFVYVASLAGDLATLGAAGEARSTGRWVILIVGLIATVIVTIYVTRIAKKALAEATHRV